LISGDDEDISIDIVMSLSPPLLLLPLIESDGKDMAPVNESIPNVIKPVPVILFTTHRVFQWFSIIIEEYDARLLQKVLFI
jgi:hypothetical protein